MPEFTYNPEAAQKTYATCGACHGADGKGLAVGAQLMAPSFFESEVVNGDPSILALVVLNGIAKEGNQYLGMMLSQKASIKTEADLANILTYLRTSFDNNAAPVTAEEAKSYIDQWESRTGLVTRAEILELTQAAAAKTGGGGEEVAPTPTGPAPTPDNPTGLPVLGIVGVIAWIGICGVAGFSGTLFNRKK